MIESAGADDGARNSQSIGAPRVSGMAVLAMLCALASLGGCAVVALLSFIIGPWAAAGIIVMPVIGLVGFALGLISLRRMRRAEGALGGRAFALIGVFVGVMSAVVQGSATVAAVGTWRSVQVTLAPAASNFVASAVAHDFERARGFIAEGARPVVTDDRLSHFFGLIDAQAGTAKGADAGLGVFARAWQALRSVPGAGDSTLQQDKVSPLPVEIECANGRVLCYVFLDSDALHDKQVKIVDLLAVLGPGSCATLQTDGPAKHTAEALGWKVTE